MRSNSVLLLLLLLLLLEEEGGGAQGLLLGGGGPRGVAMVVVGVVCGEGERGEGGGVMVSRE